MPNNPDEPTQAFYMADYMLPIDVPLVDASQSMRLDIIEQRAAQVTSMDRAQLVTWLVKYVDTFGRQLGDTQDFVSQKTHRLEIQNGSNTVVRVSLVERQGELSVVFDRDQQQSNSMDVVLPEWLLPGARVH